MHVHYFTLAGLAAEMDRLLRGAIVNEVFTQRKNELGIALKIGETVTTLTISIEPGVNHLFWRQNTSRPKRNSADLLPAAVDTTVDEISIHPTDRAIILHLSSGAKILCLLYNTVSSNVLLADASDCILDAFKRAKNLIGTIVQLRTDTAGNPLTSVAAFIARVRSSGGITIFQSLRKVFPSFGTLYTREAIARSGVREEAVAETLSGQEHTRLFEAARSVAADCAAGHAYLYEHDTLEPVLSCCPMQHLAGRSLRRFTSVNEAVRVSVTGSTRKRTENTAHDHLMKRLRTRDEQLDKLLQSTTQQVAESGRAVEYTKFGNLLMANLHMIAKGMDAVELEDIIGDGAKVRIPLSASLTPAENAERYFIRARKARSAGEEAGTRIAGIKAQRVIIEELMAALSESADDDGVDRFTSGFREELAALRITEKSEAQDRVPYRAFAVAGGYEVWVGKSSADNDELTFRYAKQHDLWFHVRGSSGSHVILRVPDKQRVVPREAILGAARIAAYYSKMKNASTVPVAYCERKYVRKPKGVPPGTVTLEREKVVFVDPALP